MNWPPAQIGALETCGVKVEYATGGISFRELEFIDRVKPEPPKPTKTVSLIRRSDTFTKRQESWK